jgi:hypothetical protein
MKIANPRDALTVRDSVTVHMAAPADEIWWLVSDITNTGRFSPETFEAEWLDGASAAAVGARFRGHVRRNGRGPVYWRTCIITECEPGRDFAFTVGEGDKASSTWRYRFEPAGDGTDVTESFELKDTASLRLYWKVFGRWRGLTNHDGMRETLERVKSVAEGGS